MSGGGGGSVTRFGDLKAFWQLFTTLCRLFCSNRPNIWPPILKIFHFCSDNCLGNFWANFYPHLLVTLLGGERGRWVGMKIQFLFFQLDMATSSSFFLSLSRSLSSEDEKVKGWSPWGLFHKSFLFWIYGHKFWNFCNLQAKLQSKFGHNIQICNLRIHIVSWNRPLESVWMRCTLYSILLKSAISVTRSDDIFESSCQYFFYKSSPNIWYILWLLWKPSLLKQKPVCPNFWGNFGNNWATF